jgi:hypothetical protein
MDPDQIAQMRRLVWIHAGHKRTMLVLSWLMTQLNFVIYTRHQIINNYVIGWAWSQAKLYTSVIIA